MRRGDRSVRLGRDASSGTRCRRLARNEQMRQKTNSWRDLRTDCCTIDMVNLMQGCNRGRDVSSPTVHQSPRYAPLAVTVTLPGHSYVRSIIDVRALLPHRLV